MFTNIKRSHKISLIGMLSSKMLLYHLTNSQWAKLELDVLKMLLVFNYICQSSLKILLPYNIYFLKISFSNVLIHFLLLKSSLPGFESLITFVERCFRGATLSNSVRMRSEHLTQITGVGNGHYQLLWPPKSPSHFCNLMWS